ncbi:MAG TPA: hypothetical protein VFO31_16785 [Vicinamibacterales bacterium]|nr:hypothetical protein [Vicinamibacterales bacterium]
MKALSLSVALLLGLACLAEAADANHRRLAEHYAPVVFQESRSTVLDFITRFDYDGDWKGDNNWRNAYLFDLTGHVYYSVIESTSHYFITYAFYHPRDYTARPYEGFAPKTEHENDMEGCTITIEKDGTPFGKVVLLETLAHDVFFKYENRDNRKVSAGGSKIDGAIQFVDGRPAVYVEAEGHGVKSPSRLQMASRNNFPGIVYRYTGTASVPGSNRDPNATYDLVAIEDTLWAHRFDVGSTFCCADSYAMNGGTTASVGSAFNGPIGGCAAKPPWGWDQANDKISKGDWFRDPLKAYPTQLRIQNFTGSYVHNPYLESDGRNAGQPCAESTTSKTVTGALTQTLLGIGRAVTDKGLTTSDIGAQSKQLFLGNNPLLEWAQKAQFQQWTWDQSLKSLPSIVTQGLRDEMRIPSLAGFSLTSPSFNAPTRYFDNLVLRYRTPLDGLRARVVWSYDQDGAFSDELSVTAPLSRADAPAIAQIRLRESPKWDESKTILRLKMLIESSTGIVAEVSPGAAPSSSDQFTISYLVFDRDAFSDTFARPK